MVLPLLASLPTLQDCTTPLQVESYGSGTSGAAHSPRLQNSGLPVAGGPYRLEVLDAPAGAAGALGVSMDSASVPLPQFGGALLLDELLLLEPFVVGSYGFAAPVASWEVPASACGLEVHAQGFVLDPTAFGGVALTQGLRVRFGEDVGPPFSGQRFGSIAEPSDVELADLDGDGDLDAIVASGAGPADPDTETPGGIVLLFNDGWGVFEDGPGYVDRGVRRVAPADLDGDGRVDLLGVTADGIELVTLLQTDGERWGDEQVYVLEGDPVDLEAADLDGDGDEDVVVADHDGDRVLLFLGDGQGGLAPSGSLDVGDGPVEVHLVDLNGDSHLDVVTVDQFAGVSLLRGDGQGTFLPALPLTIPYADNLAGAFEDLDGDGRRDIVVGTSTHTTSPQGFRLVVRLADEFGFGAPVNYLTYNRVTDLEVADVDGDGLVDVVAITCPDIRILRGLGGGTFAPEVKIGIGPQFSTGIATGDLDGDGGDDAVSVSTGADVAVVSVAIGAAYFGGPTYLPKFGVGGGGIASGYFNADPYPDLLAVSAGASGAADLYFGGSGAISPSPAFYPLPFTPTDLDVGDVDGDGDLDAVICGFGSSPGFLLLLNDGSGLLSWGSPTAGSVNQWQVELTDVDDDGLPEIVVAGTGPSIKVFDVESDGSLVLRWESSLEGLVPGDLELADLDLDGALDLLVSVKFFGLHSRLLLALGNGDGTFGPLEVVGSLNGVDHFEIADLDEDGAMDLIYRNYVFSPVLIARGNGGGGFDHPTRVFEEGARSFGAYDINDDGHLDLFAFGQNGLEVRHGDGQGGFESSEVFPGFGSPEEGAVFEDLNGDGVFDIAASLGPGVYVNYGISIR